MESRIWIRLWHRQCERTNFYISMAVSEGIVIVLLGGALGYALAR